MPGRRRSGAGGVVALALLALLIGLLRATGRLSPVRLRWASRAAAVLRPAEEALAAGAQALAAAWRDVVLLFTAEAENEALRREVASLRLQLVRLGAVEQDNRVLRELLGLRDGLRGWSTVACWVVARSPATWFDTVTLGCGRAQGVRAGMPVLAPGGLVGRVLTVGTDTAQVLLLTDPQSGAGAVVARSGDAGVALGGDPTGNLRLELYQRNPSVRPGDLVVTSGLGGDYPRGLVIGRVVAVGQEEYGLVHYAEVRPSQDLDRLTGVLVLTSWRGQPL
jgi:rod shape-determining protein MreC